jgi:D-alanine-D-alanine ligase
MKKKLKVGVLFGGKSAEHEISVRSAKNVLAALDRSKYLVTPIKIPKTGRFNLNAVKKFDVIFPVLHGPFGEDGTMQGLLKQAGVPFVGPGVLGSAVGMDKDVMKRLFRDAGVPIGKFLVFNKGDKISFKEIAKKLGNPLYIKPANMGSSVGVHKVRNEKEFNAGVADAFRYDSKIIIEENIIGREVECSVLGNEKPVASLPGEIVAANQFYSYKAKYLSKTESRTEIPAHLPKAVIKNIREIAIAAYRALCCEGLGRVDFFVKKNGRVLVNEINTIPGFTSISMYPKMWEASGLSLPKLLDKLIDFAIARHKREARLKTSFK